MYSLYTLCKNITNLFRPINIKLVQTTSIKHKEPEVFHSKI